MKKIIGVFVVGFLAGVVASYFGLRFIPHRLTFLGSIAPQPPSLCYSCLWESYDSKFRADVITFYNQYKNPDAMIMADVGYILWRASGIPNCQVRESYRRVADGNQDIHRRLMARVILGLGGPECGQDGSRDLKAASRLAEQAGLPRQSEILRQLSSGKLEPRFGDVRIGASLPVPADAKTMILGETTIEVPEGLPIGTQVERVARDWISYQMKWDMSGNPLPVASLLDYHEGRLLKALLGLVPAKIYPLAGSLAAQREQKWFAADETGTFRFEVLRDKMQYPTSHAYRSFGWIEDTHGISTLVAQALERRMQLVVGDGDSEANAKAAFYLAQKGVNVLFPGDRFQDLLVGYQAQGTLLGTAPVKKLDGKVVLGHQPVRFSLREPIVVADTDQTSYPLMYNDAGARYFRRLNELKPLNLDYVLVQPGNEIGSVLTRAAQLKATAVAVRVAEEHHYTTLRDWLASSPAHRAILFHSGLYPYAQPLFEQFPEQVTFGDLRPRFE